MTNELEDNLKQVLGWHKLRVQCLVQIVLGLIAVRTVNLKELACFFSGAAELDSTYRRLQRFFAEVKFPRHVIAQLGPDHNAGRFGRKPDYFNRWS